jgi:parvulin-like peptidyl-prolyl isomerase
MRSRGVAACLGGLALAFASLAAAQDEHGHGGPDPADLPPPPREAYAVVGDVAILRTAVHAEATSGRMPAVAALQKLITLEVLRQHLVREGHDPARVSEADLDQSVAEAKAALTAQGASPEHLAQADAMRDSLRVPVAFSLFIDGLVKDEELVAGFEERRLALAGELRLRAISIRSDASSGGEAAARAQLAAARARLGEAPTDDAFAALARTASQDPNAVLTGGDLDWQSRRAPTVPLALIDAGIALGRAGLVPEPVATSRAVHLVYVTAVRVPASATLEALLPRMRAEARSALAQEYMERWLRETPVRLADDAPHLQRR